MQMGWSKYKTDFGRVLPFYGYFANLLTVAFQTKATHVALSMERTGRDGKLRRSRDYHLRKMRAMETAAVSRAQADKNCARVMLHIDSITADT